MTMVKAIHPKILSFLLEFTDDFTILKLATASTGAVPKQSRRKALYRLHEQKMAIRRAERHAESRKAHALIERNFNENEFGEPRESEYTDSEGDPDIEDQEDDVQIADNRELVEASEDPQDRQDRETAEQEAAEQDYAEAILTKQERRPRGSPRNITLALQFPFWPQYKRGT